MQGATRRLSVKQEGHTRTVDVRIPAGVNDGSRVECPGKANTARPADAPATSTCGSGYEPIPGSSGGDATSTPMLPSR